VTRRLCQPVDTGQKKDFEAEKSLKKRKQDDNVAGGLADNVDGGRATFYAVL
jgi:hypothetical protein